MGMSLIPRHKDGNDVQYNWSGWRALGVFLDAHGVDVELAGSNDGELIRADDCRTIADAIDAHRDEYNAIYDGTPKKQGGYGDDPATDHVTAWRSSSGMRQW